MAAQQTQGIQTLLEAEKEAAKVVQEARQYRVQRLKDARADATKEIEKYRQEKDNAFKVFESTHAGSTSNLQSQVDKDTNAKLETIKKAYESHKDEVVQKLLDRLVLVKPELHRNLKKVQ